MLDAKKLLDMLVNAQGAGGGQGAAAGGGLGGIAGAIGSILGQATQGVKDAARDVDARTGASGKLDNAVRGMSGGQGAGDLLGRVKDLAGQNQLATGAVIGGLAGLLLGTKGGRGIAADAAKLGGLALIGGLAYKAFQNHQAGKPLLDGMTGSGAGVEAPPQGSGYEPAAHSNQDTLWLVRAMIAAAAADGVIDARERAAILGNMRTIGLDPETADYLEAEIANPAGAADLVAAAEGSTEMATQVYTAARIAIDVDTSAERRFLDELASGLKLDRSLVSHIEAAVAKVKSGAGA